MADTRYLKKRRQTWYFQLAVPQDVQPLWTGNSPIVLTLKTRDLSKAQRLRWELIARFNRDFDRLRSTTEQWSPEKIEDEAETFFQEYLAAFEAEALSEEACETIIEHEADRIDSGKLNDAEDAFAWAKVEAANARRAALAGLPYERRRAVWGKHGFDPVTLKARKKKKGGIRFDDAAQRYIQETQRDQNAKLREQTRGHYEMTYRLFGQWAGDISLDEVDKPKAAAFIDALSELDPNWGKRNDTKSRTFADIRKQYGGHPTGLSAKTLNRHAMALGLIWDWAAERLGFAEPNPWKGQHRKVGQKRKTEKLPYTSAELKILLAHQPSRKPSRRGYISTLNWVCWISAFSGMRLNEICSLAKTDIRKIDDVWVMDVRNAKTEAGDRLVPIHSKLIHLGILDYLDALRPEDEWLFPELKPGGPDGRRGWYLSKRFTVYRRGKKVTRIDPNSGKDRVDFHSFRRAVIACLEHSRVPQSEAAQLVGHEREGITFAVYNPAGLSIGSLKDVVEKISYEGIK